MTSNIPLMTGSYQTVDPRASTKRLIGCMSEIAAQTSAADNKADTPPIYMKRGPGIAPFADSGLPNGARGVNKMGAIVYTVIGPNLYILASTGALTQVAGPAIPGTGFVRMTNNTQCLFILLPNSSTAYTYCPNAPGAPFAQFLDPTFVTYGAIDMGFDDSYFVFLQSNGRGFYNDDGQIVSGLGPPTFTTAAVFPREFGTDPFYGMGIDHREITMLGELTSEGYFNSGNTTNSPFSSAPSTFMQMGIHPLASYSVGLQDNTLFWVAADRTIRRKNTQTPDRVSNSGIEAILESCDLTGCYSLTPSIGGHPLWVLNIPASSRTIVYDCLTTEWFELQSLVNNLGYWRPLCWYNAFGKQLVGDSQSGKIGILSNATFTEFGGPPTYCSFITQSIYSNHERITHRRVECVITAGGSTSITAGALITLFFSDDSGQTWTARETISLGALGQRQFRATWFNLGQSRDRVYRFQLTDPTYAFTVQITADLKGGKW